MTTKVMYICNFLTMAKDTFYQQAKLFFNLRFEVDENFMSNQDYKFIGCVTKQGIKVYCTDFPSYAWLGKDNYARIVTVDEGSEKSDFLTFTFTPKEVGKFPIVKRTIHQNHIVFSDFYSKDEVIKFIENTTV